MGSAEYLLQLALMNAEVSSSNFDNSEVAPAIVRAESALGRIDLPSIDFTLVEKALRALASPSILHSYSGGSISASLAQCSQMIDQGLTPVYQEGRVLSTRPGSIPGIPTSVTFDRALSPQHIQLAQRNFEISGQHSWADFLRDDEHEHCGGPAKLFIVVGTTERAYLPGAFVAPQAIDHFVTDLRRIGRDVVGAALFERGGQDSIGRLYYSESERGALTAYLPPGDSPEPVGLTSKVRKFLGTPSELQSGDIEVLRRLVHEQTEGHFSTAPVALDLPELMSFEAARRLSSKAVSGFRAAHTVNPQDLDLAINLYRELGVSAFGLHNGTNGLSSASSAHICFSDHGIIRMRPPRSQSAGSE